MNDIDFKWEERKPFGIFEGTLLGNGHSLKNLSIQWTENREVLRIGLFEQNKGTIEGLKIVGASIKVSPAFVSRNITTYVGTLAGINASGGSISDCSVSGLELVGNSHNIAELFQQQFGVDPRKITQGSTYWEKWMKQDFEGTAVSKDSNWLDLTLRVYCGGLVGSNEGKIEAVFVDGSIETNVYNLRASINDEAHTQYACAGGIAGVNSGMITSVVNSAKVSSYLECDDMGGWLGWVGDVYPAGQLYAGGIAGMNTGSGKISETQNSGALTVNYRVFAPPYAFLVGMDLNGTNKAHADNIKRGTNAVAN